ncbi:MAG TPA: hypothetical protein PKD53_01460 [Chloroflexaceae bacterium]|nr:hypothetical protein [Chloroflexaceae bacterium]
MLVNFYKRGFTVAARWAQDNRALLSNTAALVGSMVANSGLGFVYWWYAARFAPPEVVGAGSAAIALLLLLSAISVMGMSTLLITRLPGSAQPPRALILPSLAVVGATATIIGLLTAALVLPGFRELGFLIATPATLALFVCGVVANTLALVIDAVTIALLRGSIQFWRNLVAAAVKLALLVIAGARLGEPIVIYWTWTMSLVVSFAVPLVCQLRSPWRGGGSGVRWRHLLALWPSALKHHALNIVLEVPPRALPLVVTAVLSPTVNASFYITWMLALLAFSVIDSLTMVMFAMGAADPSQLPQRVRSTLRLSLLLGCGMVAVISAGAGLMLSIFGSAYASTAADTLRLLALAVFPIIVRDHYIAAQRISGAIGQATIITGIGAALEVGFAVLGAATAGLVGLAGGWLIAVALEAALMLPFLYRLLNRARAL